jgi:hypothetical protein
MLHLGIEVEIDRQTDLHFNMGVFKFLIEDIHKKANIAPSFRVTHSSITSIDDPLKPAGRSTEASDLKS